MTIHSSDSRATARAEAQAYAASYNNVLASHADADLVAAPPKLSAISSLSPAAVDISSKPAAAKVYPSLPEPAYPDAGFLRDFLANHKELESYRSGVPLPLTGQSLTLPAVIAAARFPLSTAAGVSSALQARLDDPQTAAHLARSRALVDAKLAQNKSIYGVSTGFGGSADTRTAEHDRLGFALLQHQHSGIVPTKLADEADKNYAAIRAASGSSASKADNKSETEEALTIYSSSIPSSMPPAWVRGALLIRLNSLLRGHSAASRELLEAMGTILSKGITPVVPLRGSISASGDLSPLSYIAGTIVGEKGIYVTAPSPKTAGTTVDETVILRARDALEAYGISPVSLRPKEHLAILNGTAFSCALGALCVEETRTLVLLGAVCTAFGTEALRGSIDSFCGFIQRVRPHPGQIETGALLTHLLEGSRLATSHLPERARYGSTLDAVRSQSQSSSGASSDGPATPADVHHGRSGGAWGAKDVEGAIRIALESDSTKETVLALDAHDEDDDAEETIDKDAGTLRQDRYPLRTAPQWLGPQLEVVQKAAETIRIECNSTTDNPLIDPSVGAVHHGGNFQALAVTTAIEPLRLALFHVGKLLFSQATELQNPAMSGGGLAGNLAATDPSLNFFGKGVDIAMAAYVSELAYLANPVSTGVQSAEMHNQAVNSLALVSARYTLQAIEVLQLITASYIYILCQAVDLRALQRRARILVSSITARTLAEHLSSAVPSFALPSGSYLSDDEALINALTGSTATLVDAVWATYDNAASLDGRPRADKAAKAAVQGVVEILLAGSESAEAATVLARLPALQSALSDALFEQYGALVNAFLDGSFSPSSSSSSSSAFYSKASSYTYLPALPLLGRTRALYTFVRRPKSEGGLGIAMHGRENARGFAGGLGAQAGGVDGKEADVGRTIGVEIGLIYEAIKSGRIGGVLGEMFEGVEGL